MVHRFNIDRIRNAAERYRLKMRYHASMRAEERNIHFDDIRRVIMAGDVIEQDESAFPYPKFLLLGYMHQMPFYIVIGYDEEKDFVHVVTVHWQDSGKWINDRTRRRKPKP